MQNAIKPFEFETYSYNPEELNARCNWYLEKVTQTYELLENNPKSAIEFFRSYNILLRQEYHHYKLKKVSDVMINNRQNSDVKKEFDYVGWVTDVYAKQIGQTTLKNITSVLYDYDDYAVHYGFKWGRWSLEWERHQARSFSVLGQLDMLSEQLRIAFIIRQPKMFGVCSSDVSSAHQIELGFLYT